MSPFMRLSSDDVGESVHGFGARAMAAQLYASPEASFGCADLGWFEGAQGGDCR